MEGWPLRGLEEGGGEGDQLNILLVSFQDMMATRPGGNQETSSMETKVGDLLRGKSTEVNMDCQNDGA